MDNIRKRSREQLLHESPVLQWNCEDSQSGFCVVTDLQKLLLFPNKWDIPISKLSSKTHLQESHQKKQIQTLTLGLATRVFPNFPTLQTPKRSRAFWKFWPRHIFAGNFQGQVAVSKGQLWLWHGFQLSGKSKKWRRFAKFNQLRWSRASFFGWYPPSSKMSPRWDESSPGFRKSFGVPNETSRIKRWSGVTCCVATVEGVLLTCIKPQMLNSAWPSSKMKKSRLGKHVGMDLFSPNKVGGYI